MGRKFYLFLLVITLFSCIFLAKSAQAIQQEFSCVCGAGKEATCQSYTQDSAIEMTCKKGCVVRQGACPTDDMKTCGNEPGQSACVKLENPLNISDAKISVQVIIGNIIKAFLGIIGSIAMVMIVKGGANWLLSAGNPEKVQKGTKTMMWAVIGVILVMASYVLLDYLMIALSPLQ